MPLDSFGVPIELRWPCLESVRAAPTVANALISPRGYHSQLGEDKLLFEYFFNAPEWRCRANRSATPHPRCKSHPPTYLELGANDGLKMSNTVFYEETLGWQGLLVEAVPKYCDRIVNHRCGGNQNVVACGAVCKPTDGGSVELLLMEAMSGSPSMGLYESHIHNKREDNPEWQRRVNVPCAPLSALLARAGLWQRRIDLFSLDVEGAELQVPVASYRPCLPL